MDTLKRRRLYPSTTIRFRTCKQQKQITTWKLGPSHMIVARNFQGNPSVSRVMSTGMLQKQRRVDAPNTCTRKTN